MNEPKIDIGYYDTKILYEGCMMYAKTAPLEKKQTMLCFLPSNSMTS